jgi:hypothetical protein
MFSFLKNNLLANILKRLIIFRIKNNYLNHYKMNIVNFTLVSCYLPLF